MTTRRALACLALEFASCVQAHAVEASSGIGLRDAPETRISADRTITVGEDVPTLAAALGSLDGVTIDRNARVLVRIEPGLRTEPRTVVFDHPYGNRVFVMGAPPLEIAISDAVAVVQRAGSHEVRLRIASTQGFEPGLFVGIVATSGPVGHELHRGVWKILSVDGPHTVTLDNTISHGAPPVGVRGKALLYRTVLRFEHGSGIKAASLGGLSDLAIVGSGEPNSIGVWGRDPASTGIGAIAVGPRLAVSGFGADGVRANYGGAVHALQVIASSNGNNGFMARDNGSMTAVDSVASGNGLRNVPGGGCGFLAQNSGSIYASRIESWGNVGDGLFARSQGSLLVDTDGPAQAGNNLNGFHAAYGGFLQCVGCSASSNAGHGFVSEIVSSLLAQRSLAVNSGADGFASWSNAYLDASGSTSRHNQSRAFATRQNGIIFMGRAMNNRDGQAVDQGHRHGVTVP